MENLKQLLLASLFICLSAWAQAQSDAIMQKAFAASYTSESKYNYTDAIAQINNIYAEKNYEMNLERLSKGDLFSEDDYKGIFFEFIIILK